MRAVSWGIPDEDCAGKISWERKGGHLRIAQVSISGNVRFGHNPGQRDEDAGGESSYMRNVRVSIREVSRTSCN